MTTGARELDVVVFGASGFVGRLVAEYLAHHAPDGVRIGLAGRSQERLTAVRAGLGPKAAAWPLIVADAGDAASLERLAARTQVVATTVGPYRRDGMPLVVACTEARTHYADLTGEVAFMRDSIDTCHDTAARNGVRIVHACGFDSIPSDLGVQLLHETVHAAGDGDLEDTTLAVTALRGGFSGGTLASAMQQLDEVRANPGLRRLAADPYALSPARAAEPDLGLERDLTRIRYDASLGAWTGPFIMARFNTRVVRRSNALQDWAYGRRFRYQEVTGFGPGRAGAARAGLVTSGLGVLAAGLAFTPARPLLSRLLPAPGEGPSEKTRRTGYFRMRIHTRTSSGERYVARVEATGDPGYQATAVMLGESALCLAFDTGRLPGRAGVLTPATAMGSVLAARLRSAGQTLAAQRVTG